MSSRVVAAARTAAGSARAEAVPFARRHWLFLALLVAGAALRVVTQFAYQPALIYFDSLRYLEYLWALEPSHVRPFGYSAFLGLFPLHTTFALVPAVQHLMGLGIAALIYALLLRLGVRRWLAAVAAAPVLLDAYQLNIEQFLLTETLFALLVLGACALLLWRRPPGLVAAALAGALIAGATLTRGNALLVIVPAVMTLVFLRARPSRIAALVVCFVVPVVGYMGWFKVEHGSWAMTTYGDRFVYARVAPFADCTSFEVPPREQALCPTQPVGQRPTVDDYTWSNELSPVYSVEPPPGMTANQLAGDFAKRVIRNQPLDYAETVTRDFLRGFVALTRETGEGETPVKRWQFQTTYPTYRNNATEALAAYGHPPGRVVPELASFLRGYQRFGFVPGPLLGAALVIALLAALGVGRARRSGLRTATFLFAAAAIVIFGTSVAVSQFTWRYQLPQLVFLPPALALGATALWGRRRESVAVAPEDARPSAYERPPADGRPDGRVNGGGRSAPRPATPVAASRQPQR